MADVSKINNGTETFDIKDAAARQAAADIQREYLIADTTTDVNPIITDSADGMLQGLTVQGESRKSKNLFDKTKITDNALLDWDGVSRYTTETPSDGYYVTNYIPVYAGKTIHIPASGTARRFLYNLDKTIREYLNNSSDQNLTVSNDGYIRVSYYKEVVSADNLQIELGSEPTPYEPYFSGIHGTGEDGELEITTCGKNLFDKNDQYSTNDNFLNENGLIVPAANWSYTDYIPVSGISVAMSYSATEVGNNPSICFYDANKMYISGVAYHNNHSLITPIPNNAAYCRASYYSTWIDTFQLELGTTATTYESYKSTSATVTTGIPLYSVGDVKDELDEKKGVVVKKCEKVVFDGSEDEEWTQFQEGSTLFINANGLPLSSSCVSEDAVANAICNNQTIYSLNTVRIGTTRGLSLYNQRVDIRTDATSSADFRAYLASNPVTVVYELAEPYELPLTSAELSALRNLRTYSSTTNITITDDPEFTVDYIKNSENGQAVADLQTELQKQIDEIASKAEPNVQSDWNQIDASANDYIKNKPDLTEHLPIIATTKTSTSTKLKVEDNIGIAVDVAWAGMRSVISSSHIWTDGNNTYYSNGSNHYILNEVTSTWNPKTWSGITNFYGYYIWTDGNNTYYSDNSNQYVLDKATSTWSPKIWSGLTSFKNDHIWTDGNNTYYSNGSNHYILNEVTSTWNPKTWSGITNFYGYYIWTDGNNTYYSVDSDQYVLDKATSTWTTKTWNGLTSFRGNYIWTDGTDIYYSSGSNQYVLDKATSTWTTKTWSGLTSFSSNGVWTDGNNIYYCEDFSPFSESSPAQYVLDKATSTWNPKTWSGITNFYGYYIWTDGNNIYYSANSAQYVLDKATSIWSPKIWSGLTSFTGDYIWTDGNNIYYSKNSNQYVLDKATSTWSPKIWSGLTSFRGDYIWTDGTDIYYSSGSNQYVLDKATSTWTTKTWSGLTSFNGSFVWTDGTDIYFSNNSNQYVLDKSTNTWNKKTWSGFTIISGNNVWTDRDNIYYSSSSNQYVLNKSTSTWTAKTWNGLTSFNGSFVWTDGTDIYYSNITQHKKLINRRYS